MKHKTKCKIKFALLIFAVSFLLTNCEKDDDLLKEQPSTKQQAPSKYLDPVVVFETEMNQNKTLKQTLTKLKGKDAKGKTNTTSKLILNDSLNIAIEDSSAKYLETPDGSYHSYTFVAFDYDHPQGIQNIVLSLQPDGTYKELLMRYDLTDQETILFRNNEPIDLEGKVSFALLDENSFASDVFLKETANVGCLEFSYDSGSNCIAGGDHTYADGDACVAWGTWQGAHQGPVTSSGINWDCVDAGSGSSYTPPTTYTNTPTGQQSGAGGGTSTQQDASSGYAPTPKQERESDFIKKLIANDSSDCFISLPLSQQVEIFNFLENGLSITINGEVLNENPSQYNESDVDFAEQAALALCGDSDLEFDDLLQLFDDMDKRCQATFAMNFTANTNSPLVELITDNFFNNETNNLVMSDIDLPSDLDANATTLMPAGMIFNENTTAYVIFDNLYLDSATNLSIALTTAHEFVHLHLAYLYSSGTLLTNYSNYTAINNAFLAYKNNPTQENGEILNDAMHEKYDDFLDMITNSVFQYASNNNTEGATLEYCNKLVLGAHQYTLDFQALSEAEQTEYSTITTNEQEGNDQAKGTNCE